MRRKLTQFVEIVREDPAVDSVVGFTGGGPTNSGFVFVDAEAAAASASISADQVIARLRPKLAAGAGRQPVPAGGAGHPGRRPPGQRAVPVHAAGRRPATTCYTWAPQAGRGAAAGRRELADVNSDQQQRGLQVNLDDRPRRGGAARRHAAQIDTTLYDAFGQRQVSTIYNALNQYHVVMEVAPEYWQSPEALKDIYVSTSGGAISGAQATGAVVVDRRRSGAPAPSIRPQAVRNQRTNAIAVSGPRLGLDRGGGQHHARDDDAAVGSSPATSSARRRWRSTTRACSSPPRSRSTWRRA